MTNIHLNNATLTVGSVDRNLKEHQPDANLCRAGGPIPCGACTHPTEERSFMRGGGGYKQGSFVYSRHVGVGCLRVLMEWFVCCFVLLTRGWGRLEMRPPVALPGIFSNSSLVLCRRLSPDYPSPICLRLRFRFNLILSFLSFLSLFSKTQPDHWTKRMASTRLLAYDPRTCPRPEDRSIT